MKIKAEYLWIDGQRLTGKHETCPITEFRYGVSDRGASIRIPMATANLGYGYLEDRRPAANMDPYQVCAALIETVCGDMVSSSTASSPTYTSSAVGPVLK